jgi:hypothetical protein
MKDHKLVIIYNFFENMRKMLFFFIKICLKNFLGFDRMHENKILFFFLERGNSFKIFKNFLKSFGESRVF